MMGYAVVYNILAIGEAAYKLTNAFCKEHPETQWNDIMLMRNVLAHDYYKLKLQTVWEVVQHDLPNLREQVNHYLAETDWEEWEKNAIVVKESAVHKNMVQTARRMKQRGYDTDENFEGFYFAISWTGLTKVYKSVQRLTDEREGKEQGNDLI